MAKFDFAIGNPPYNQEAQLTSTSDDPVYHIFMDAANRICDKVLLITPARFLMNAGKTPEKWNLKMLNDPHFSVVDYFENSQSVFPNALIPGGIAITYRDSTTLYEPIEHFIPFNELREIDKKVRAFKEPTLDTMIYSQNKFNLENLYKDYPEIKKEIGSDGKDKRFRQYSLERFPFLFTEERTPDSMRILGLIDRKRSYRYISKKYVEDNGWNEKYKVFVPFSNGASGTLGEKPARLISKPVIGMPNDGITQTFIGIGQFDTCEEAQNLFKYINSKFARVLLGILKVTQGNKSDTWKHVPIQDFTNKSEIDWTLSKEEIDQQLYNKYSLTPTEIDFIENKVVYL